MPRLRWRNRLSALLRAAADRLDPATGRRPATLDADGPSGPPEFWLARARAGRPVGMPPVDAPGVPLDPGQRLVPPQSRSDARPQPRSATTNSPGPERPAARASRPAQPPGGRADPLQPPVHVTERPARRLPPLQPHLGARTVLPGRETGPQKTAMPAPAARTTLPEPGSRQARPPQDRQARPTVAERPAGDARPSPESRPEGSRPSRKRQGRPPVDGGWSDAPSAVGPVETPGRPQPVLRASAVPSRSEPGSHEVPARPEPRGPSGGARHLLQPPLPEGTRARLAARGTARAEPPPAAPLPLDGLWPELPRRPAPVPEAGPPVTLELDRRQRLVSEQAAT